jgi:hypothetical protein
MAKALDEQHSPFQRAVDEGLAGQGGAKSTKSIAKRRGRPVAGTPDWAPVFLEALTEGESITGAAASAGVHVTLVYRRRREEEAFRNAWREAANIGTELLEEEAARRAYHGTERPVFHQGRQCGTVREYSDVLLMFLLKKRDPTYRDSNNITVNNNTINVFDDIERDTQLILERDTQLIAGQVDPASVDDLPGQLAADRRTDTGG